MDAKPHRPLRSMRTFNDENARLDAPLPKTIHHRNKSSPALSGVVNGIGLKAAAKRTAFGDVSNILPTIRTTKEEASHLSKPNLPNTKLNHAKSAAFLRPAQRPLSVTGLKNLLTGSNNNSNHINASAESQSKAPSHETFSAQPTANVRKLLTKRNTTIFKDAPLDTVQEIDRSDPQKQALPPLNLPQEAPISSPVEHVHQDPQLRLPPPTTVSVTEPVKAPSELVTHPVNALVNHVFINDVPTSTESYPVVRPRSEVSIQHSDTQSAPQHEHDAVLIPEVHVPSETLVATAIKRPETQLSLPPLQTAIGAQAPLPLPLNHQLMQLPAQTEAEESWEDEEDNYEEEGYVTARSFRSKGDNTTSGATTVLVPRMNQRARREIEAATKLVEATRTAEEIEDESFDTSMVAEYGDEIFEYMRQLEVKMSPNPHYMDNQHEIQWSMRSVLMDWLVQVHHRFNLLPETLFLCVNYIDRFLSCKVVSLGKLQLVGATAIFIAAKYEEINCPSVQEIVYMVDGGYTIDEILKAERFMLTMLQFELGWPGPMSFLRRISKADDYDLETRTLAKYFLEVTLMDERFIGSPPSFTAAASHCLARLMLRKGSWSPHHVYYSGYTYAQLRPLVQLLLECCEDPTKHHRAVYDKYCDKRYKRASAFVQTEVQRGFYLPELPPVKVYAQSPTYAYYTNTPYYGS